MQTKIIISHTHTHALWWVATQTHIVDSIIWCCGLCHHRPKPFSQVFIRCSVCSKKEWEKVLVWRIFEKVHAPCLYVCTWYEQWTEQRVDRSKCHLNCSEFLSFYCRKKFFVAFLCYLKSFWFESRIKWKIREGNCQRWKPWWEHSVHWKFFWCLVPFLSETGGMWEFMVRAVCAMCVNALKARWNEKSGARECVRKVVGNHNQQTHSTH